MSSNKKVQEQHRTKWLWQVFLVIVTVITLWGLPSVVKQDAGSHNLLSRMFSTTIVHAETGDDDTDDGDTDNSGDSNNDEFAKAASVLSSKISKGEKSDVIKNKADTSSGNLWSYFGPKSGFFGLTSKSSYSTSYSNMEGLFDADSDKKTTKSQRQASKNLSGATSFAYMLNQTGLDHSFGAGFGNSALTAMGRFGGGALLIVAYLASSLVQALFKFMFGVLDAFNVFKWMRNVGAAPDFIKPVARMFNNLYKWSQGMGLVGMSLVLGVMIFAAIMGIRGMRNRGQSTAQGLGQAIIGLIERAFVIVGLPLMLAVGFSSVISMGRTMYSQMDQASPASYAIYSNMIDFKGWVEGSRLALPDRAKLSIPAERSAKSVPIIFHKQVLAINASGAGRKNAQDLYNGLYYGTGSEKDHSPAVNKTGNGKDKGLAPTPFNMLLNWTTGDSYTAADWASYVQTHYKRGKLSDGLAYNKKKVSIGKKVEKGELLQDGNLTINKNGNLKAPGSARGLDNQDRSKPGSEYGALSTMGMYNYLSSTFNPGGFAWTDVTSLSSKFTSPEHYSIGLTGRGATAMGNYVLMFGMILAVAMFGGICLLMTIDGLFVSMPKMFAYMTLSGFGSLKSGLKLVIVFADFTINVLGGGIFYLIGTDLLVALSNSGDSLFGGQYVTGTGTIVANWLPGNVGNLHGVTEGALNSVAYGGYNAAIGILLVWVALKLIKQRNAILQIVTEGSKSLLDIISGASVDGNGPSNAPITNNAGSTGGSSFGGNSYTNGAPGLASSDADEGFGSSLGDGSDGANGADGGLLSSNGGLLGDGSDGGNGADGKDAKAEGKGGEGKAGDGKNGDGTDGSGKDGEQGNAAQNGSNDGLAERRAEMGDGFGAQAGNGSDAEANSSQYDAMNDDDRDVSGDEVMNDNGLTDDQDAMNAQDGNQYSMLNDAAGDESSQDLAGDEVMGDDVAGAQVGQEDAMNQELDGDDVAGDQLDGDAVTDENGVQQALDGDQYNNMTDDDRDVSGDEVMNDASNVQDNDTMKADSGNQYNAMSSESPEGDPQAQAAAGPGNPLHGPSDTHQSIAEENKQDMQQNSRDYSQSVHNQQVASQGRTMNHQQQSNLAQSQHNAASASRQMGRQNMAQGAKTMASSVKNLARTGDAVGSAKMAAQGGSQMRQGHTESSLGKQLSGAPDRATKRAATQAYNSNVRTMGAKAARAQYQKDIAPRSGAPKFTSAQQATSSIKTASANYQQASRNLQRTKPGTQAYAAALTSQRAASANLSQVKNSARAFSQTQQAPKELFKQQANPDNTPRLNQAGARSALTSLNKGYAEYSQAKASGDEDQIRAAGKNLVNLRNTASGYGLSKKYTSSPAAITGGLKLLNDQAAQAAKGSFSQD